MNAAMTFIGQPYTTAPILRRAVGKSYTATRGALANLESLGIVKAVKGGSSIGYMAEDVMLAVSAAACPRRGAIEPTKDPRRPETIEDIGKQDFMKISRMRRTPRDGGLSGVGFGVSDQRRRAPVACALFAA